MLAPSSRGALDAGSGVAGVIGRGGNGYEMRHSEWRRVCAAIEPRRGGTSQTWRNLGSDVSDKLCVE